MLMARIPPEEVANAWATWLAPKRPAIYADIFRVLFTKGYVTPRDLYGKHGVSQRMVSKYLSRLVRLGVLKKRRRRGTNGKSGFWYYEPTIDFIAYLSRTVELLRKAHSP